MADANKFREWALTLAGTAAAFESGSLMVGGDPITEELRSGNSLLPEIEQILSKRPEIGATLFDPSLVTAWAALGVGGIVACFRAYVQDGGATGTYRSFTMADGIIMPVSLRASAKQAARLSIRALGIFSAGVAFTTATDAVSPADLVVAYYPKSLAIGGSPVTGLTEIDVNWEYQVQDDDQVEPAYYHYDDQAQRGTAKLKDLTAATVARLEDGTQETVVATFEDLSGSGADVSVNLGTCQLYAKVNGSEADLTFSKLA